MNVLVTGGAGFIGRALVEKLTAGGHRVAVVDDGSGRGCALAPRCVGVPQGRYRRCRSGRLPRFDEAGGGGAPGGADRCRRIPARALPGGHGQCVRHGQPARAQSRRGCGAVHPGLLGWRAIWRFGAEADAGDLPRAAAFSLRRLEGRGRSLCAGHESPGRHAIYDPALRQRLRAGPGHVRRARAWCPPSVAPCSSANAR